MEIRWNGIGFYLTVCSFLIGFNQGLQLCQNGIITTSSRNLNMDSSQITGSSGMCSCQITLSVDAKITMFAVDIKSQDCKTNIALSDTSYSFPCMNGNIAPVTSYGKDIPAGSSLWVFVTSTAGSQAMSGLLQIKSKPSGTQFTLECFEPNTNTTVTISMPTTTTTTTTTTTPTTTLVLPTNIPSTTEKIITIPPQQPTTTKSSLSSSEPTTKKTTTTPSQQPQSSTTASSITTQTDDNITSTAGSNSSTTGSTTNSSSGSSGIVAPENEDDSDFPVGAVVGGIIGGLAFIIIIILIAVCLRKRRKEPRLLESGQKPSKGHKNKAYDNGVPHLRDNLPKHSLYASTPITLDNDSGQRSKDPPGQFVPVENDNDLVEGSEVVVTSSGDIYAIVDKSNPERNKNYPSSDDVYASVDKSSKPNVSFNNQSGNDLYATVNKSRPDVDEEDEAAAISRMMQVPDEVLQDRISSVQSTAL